MDHKKKPNLSAKISCLPLDCLLAILALVIETPKEACRLAFVSSAFRWAADSDFIWDKLLPPECWDLISETDSDLPPSFRSKKDLYMYLCDNPILLQEQELSFSLEKDSGKKCYMVGGSGLSIFEGHNPAHWKWTPSPDSRFPVVAELLGIHELAVSGNIEPEMLSKKTCYAGYLVFRTTENSIGLEVSGSTVSRHFNKQYYKFACQNCCLESPPALNYCSPPQKRMDGKMEVMLGRPFCSSDIREDAWLSFSFFEIEYLNWKSGLIVEGIEVRPTHGHAYLSDH